MRGCPRSPVGDARFGHPAYADGMTVEYFSCTNKCWLLGVVSLDAIYNGKTLVSVLYNVDLGRTRQMRYDVKIDLLRRPPEQGEMVEVQRHAGHPWLPGRILKVRWSREGRLYCALLDEPDEHHGNEVSSVLVLSDCCSFSPAFAFSCLLSSFCSSPFSFLFSFCAFFSSSLLLFVYSYVLV